MLKSEVEQLVRDALRAEGVKREKHMDELCLVVKQLECDERELLEPVEWAMPLLAKYLLDEDNGNVNGCTISIFRRIPLNRKTIIRLLQLQERQPNKLVVEALGKISPSDWSDKIEETFAKALEHEETAGAAAYALYCKSYCVQQTNTILALANAVWSTDWLTARRAILALACISKQTHSIFVIELLDEILDRASPELRTEIADCLGWATNRGLTLLQRLATDESPIVRAAVAKSLGQGYSEKVESKRLLEILKCDVSPKVQKAAIEALNPPQC